MKQTEIDDVSLRAKQVLDTIRTIHRGPDGYIAFMAKRGENLVDLFSCTVEELENNFSHVQHHLVTDAYFSINSMYRAKRHTDKLTGLSAALRNEDSLRFLNACFVDLDVGRPSGNAAETKSVNDVAAELSDLIHSGLIPQCSLFATSGQGCYAFWLLHDEKTNSRPPRCWPDNLILYKRINKVLCDRLKHLAADRRAADGARVLRVPTSKHSKTDAKVTYHHLSYGDGKLITYSLSELAYMMGVVEVDEINEAVREWSSGISSPEKQSQSKRQPQKIAGLRELNAKRARDLVRLAQSRGGWKKGKRKAYLTLHADFLRGTGKGKTETIELLEEMAKICIPPYPSDKNDTPVEVIVSDVFDRNHFTYSDVYLVNFLGIKSDECRELELETMVTREVKAERRKPAGGDRALARERRQNLLIDFVSSGQLTSTRDLVKYLKSKGLPATKSSVATDLRRLSELGLIVNRKRVGRPALASPMNESPSE